MLHTAARAGNTECVEIILQHKVHVGSQDGRKMTALHHAGKTVMDYFEVILIFGYYKGGKLPPPSRCTSTTLPHPSLTLSSSQFPNPLP